MGGWSVDQRVAWVMEASVGTAWQAAQAGARRRSATLQARPHPAHPSSRTWKTAPSGVAAAEPTPTPTSMAWLDSMPRT